MTAVVERIIREEVREYLSAYFGVSKPAPRKRSYEPGPIQMHSPVVGNGLGTPQKKTLTSKIADMKTGEILYVRFDEFVESYNKSTNVKRNNPAVWLADKCRTPGCMVAKKYGRKYNVSRSEFETKNAVAITRTM
jgi:hypothetical protein